MASWPPKDGASAPKSVGKVVMVCTVSCICLRNELSVPPSLKQLTYMFVTHVKKTQKEIVPNYSIYSSLFILHNSFAFIYPDVFVLFYYCGFFLFIYIL
jgi:hypothetical protein